ncbi:malto-oligosyltrehalose synthase [Granulicella sp. WH15]|uniref:malto-oligosyltrehalose synthase n=1 Tax=Granulicella sp. WH15 TaxID=2602070 RepID=UPI0013676F56|nr:malto-oligosyltrehalose synthase [Granulicella sp. WH15]QHN04278.1 malto-oligosyltrehalose synthase [Granulicella sp. WH15]
MIRVPSSTYRLQLHRDFTFDDAAAVAEYLWDLGVSHVYSSPYLQAAPGSMHGYDVVDHQRVNAELGGEIAHQRFVQAFSERGMGQVLDIVPNHMALGRENRYWWDVLENGSSSRYASFFDIDWQPQEERLRNKVLVPVLADQYGRVLEQGGIKAARSGGAFLVECAGQTLPINPSSFPVFLNRAADYSRSDTLSFLSASFSRLPVPDYGDRRAVLVRHRDKGVLLKLLERLCSEEVSVCKAIDHALRELNKNLDALDDFLNQQNYRLAYWKTADQQLGYRRFFDVNNLIGLRMEREHVFEETHALVLDWLRRGVLDGVRVDHPDGLRDPLEYFKRLREAAPEAWIIGEKILEPGEFMRQEWPIEGTTGYDFLNVVGGLLLHQTGLEELTRIYAEFTGQPTDFHAIAREKKINVEQEALGSDVNRLTSLFVEICESNRNQRDYTRAEMRRAIREIGACFSIYRTYVVPQREEITDEDRCYITQAIDCAKERRTDIDDGLFDFMHDVLTLQVRGRLESEFVLRFQQFTSPVMAKGVEDTAFYCFNRLTSVCEVGGDPARGGLSVEEFHAFQQKMQETHPRTMTTLSTHDTKRSDDVRARLAVLTEIPAEFGEAVVRWAGRNAGYRSGDVLDRNTEYFYYQTLIGAWPLDAERAKAYMMKAMREAKQQTSWVANNKAYEDALNSFIEQTLADEKFCAEVERFVQRILVAGRINSLTQTLLKHTAPGVPDLYQGAELWDLSLVDPDNRRPVDYEERRRVLAELKHLKPAEVLTRMDEGMPKMFVIHHALWLRRQHPEWFGEGAEYVPVTVTGSKQPHVIAYLRADAVLTVAPRLTTTLAGKWEKTAVSIPKGKWRNRLTEAVFHGGVVPVEDLLKEFPVALLTREGA